MSDFSGLRSMSIIRSPLCKMCFLGQKTSCPDFSGASLPRNSADDKNDLLVKRKKILAGRLLEVLRNQLPKLLCLSGGSNFVNVFQSVILFMVSNPSDENPTVGKPDNRNNPVMVALYIKYNLLLPILNHLFRINTGTE